MPSLAPRRAAHARPRLTIHIPPAEPPGPSSTRWLVAGWPATITIWTAEQWASLADRPADAQPHASGAWCALRMEG